MNKAAWLILALVSTSGCKDKGGESKARRPADDLDQVAADALPEPTTEQIIGLTHGLNAVASAAPDMRVATLAQLMHETVAPDDACFADAGSELTQSQDYQLDRILACVRPCAIALAELTRMAPETRIPAIRTRCKDAIDLAADDLDLLTPQLLLTARAARLLGHAHRNASSDRKRELAAGIEAAELILPMPAWTQSYRLPTAPVAVSRPVMVEHYLIVTADGQALHQAPRARLADGLVKVEQPGADLPPARPVVGIAPHPALHDTGVDVDKARQQAIEQARQAGILGVLEEQAREQEEQQRSPRAMIVADAQMSARAVVEAGHRLGGAMLGVTGGGATAWALLVDDPGVAGEPEQRIRFGASETRPAMTIAITTTDTVATAGQGEPRTIARAGSAVDIEAIRAVVREWRGQPELQEATDIAIEVSGEASYRDLVDVLSALAQDAPYLFYLRVTDR